MDVSREERGEWASLLAALLWAFFPIVTVLSYRTLPGLISLAWSVVFATLLFGILITYHRKWREILNPTLWLHGLMVAIFTVVIYYGLYFTGLQTTTPGNAAIIALFEVFTSFLFFNVIRGERISRRHRVGAVLMVIGALIVLGRNFSGISAGDFYILAATFFSPIGNLFLQKARGIASSEAIMFLRNLFAIPFLFLLAYVFHAHATSADLRLSLIFLVINGTLLLGLSKLLWVEAIYRISVTKATALSSISPFLTVLLAWVLLHQAPNIWQFVALVPLILGMMALTDSFEFI